MTGKACISVTKYYNSKLHRLAFKQRPVLIIGLSDTSDYVALPISRVLNRNCLDPVYDFPMEIDAFPCMNLCAKSYIRSHKQFIVNETEITNGTVIIYNFKKEYPEAYSDILNCVKKFQNTLINTALCSIP